MTHYFRFALQPAVERQRSLLLERLLARADAVAAVSDWRADAFRIVAPSMTAMPGVGATALYADRGPLDAGRRAASVFVATPVQYVAEISNVRLPGDGILALVQTEAGALAEEFNREWSDAGIGLLAGRAANLFCVIDQPLVAITADPAGVLGRRIEHHLPAGAGGPRLRRLMSEIEMWLFEHAVNRSRTARGAPAVNGLWLWGGGPAVEALPAMAGWAAGDDVFFNALAARPDAPTPAGSGVVVIASQPGTEGWREGGLPWLERSLADLQRGRIGRIDLSAGNRCFSIGARWRRRFWRRTRPWWEGFA
jgi:hypothetical protein